jgi:hypothetical protein
MLFCFEDSWIKECTQEHGSVQGTFLSWEEFIDFKHSEVDTEVFNSITQDLETIDKPRFLPFIELLRKSLVFSGEDIDFGFSSLPVSPRLHSIRLACKKYLESALSNDLAAKCWSHIESIKNFQISCSEEPTIFVKGAEPTALFAELAKTYQTYGSEKNQYIDTWEWNYLSKGANHRVFTADRATGLEFFVRAIKNRALEKPALFFQGNQSTYQILNILNQVSHIPAIAVFPYHPMGVFGPAFQWCYFEEAEKPYHEKKGLLAEGDLERLRIAGFALPHSRAEDKTAHWIKDNPVPTRLITPFYNDAGVKKRNIPAKDETNQLPLKEEKKLGLSVSTLSASQLDKYAKCPQRWLWENHWKIQSKKVTDALIFGKLVHETLKECLELNPEDIPRSEDLFNTFIAKLDETVSPSARYDSAVQKIYFKQKFVPIAENFPQLEKKLRLELGFCSRVSFEQRFEFKWKEISLLGSIDRVDRSSKDALLLIDYKTGNVSFSPEQLSRGENFQVLLYWMASEKIFGKKPEGFLFYDLKEFSLKRGLFLESLFPAEMKKLFTRGHVLTEEKSALLIENAKNALDHQITLIQEGHIQANPSAENCGYCDYATHCRKAYQHG